MKEKLLFDASSLIYALKLKYIEILHGNYIQHLTIYEILNAIWKETYLIKSIAPSDAEKLINIIIETLDYLNVLSIHPYEVEVFKKAMDLGLTIYDTSYVILAEKNNLILVTEDRKLIERASKAVKTVSLEELVNNFYEEI